MNYFDVMVKRIKIVYRNVNISPHSSVSVQEAIGVLHPMRLQEQCAFHFFLRCDRQPTENPHPWKEISDGNIGILERIVPGLLIDQVNAACGNSLRHFSPRLVWKPEIDLLSSHMKTFYNALY